MKLKRFPLVVVALLFTTLAAVAQEAQLDPSSAKLQQHVSNLASDALDGRRTGTAGANDAARYIAGEFARLGLRAGNDSGNARRRREVMAQYLQSFPYVAGLELGAGNSFAFGNNGSLQPSVDWLPLGFSANTKAEGGLVFVGYGITAAELNYNDYAGLNSTGKIAIALQGTPDGDNPHGHGGRAGPRLPGHAGAAGLRRHSRQLPGGVPRVGPDLAVVLRRARRRRADDRRAQERHRVLRRRSFRRPA